MSPPLSLLAAVGIAFLIFLVLLAFYVFVGWVVDAWNGRRYRRWR